MFSRRTSESAAVYMTSRSRQLFPNQVWTWHITKLAGPERGVFYCRGVLRERGLAVIEMAEILQKSGRLSEDDLPDCKGG